MNTPAIEHRHNHRAKLLQRVLTDAVEQFRPGNMTHADALDLLLLLGCEVERVAQKDVAVPVITRVIGDNRLERFGESNLLHQQKTCPSTRLLKDNRQCQTGNCERFKPEIVDFALSQWFCH